jgi:alpha-tubulin suppressor-like RCC1 family protein
MSSITYPDNMTECTNILLIDESVAEASLFFTSVNESTFPIMYSNNSTKNGLLTLLQTKFTTIQRIAFVFHTSGSMVNTFLDNKPFFLENEEPHSENVDFLISLFNQFKVKNVDYLACNTLNYPNWVNYYQLLIDSTGIIVGASNDETGNIKYGGDWIMESTSENIELIYFTKSIEYYNYLLGGNICNSSLAIQDNLLYGTGLNTNGQLGLGNNTAKILRFTQITFPDSKSVKLGACGSAHTVVLTTDNFLYATGRNSEGQLGLSNNTPQNIFQPCFQIPSNKTIKDIDCGSFFTVFLTTDGLLYGTGQNSFGQLGLNITNNPTTFQLITIPNKLIKQVACGGNHTVVLTTDFLLYVTGLNTSGQLGIGNNITPPQKTFQQITIPGKIIKQVSCGGEYTVVLTTDNLLYVTGLNGLGQLGLNNTISKNTFEQCLSIPNKTIKQINCGAAYTLLLTTDNFLYGTGQNGNNQLGFTGTAITFQLIPFPIGKTVNGLTGCGSHTLALTTDNLIYGTGGGGDGQLGTGGFGQLSFFTRLSPAFTGTNVSYIMDMTLSKREEISNICFPAGTPVLTDQGLIPIDQINIEVNTINQKKIVDIAEIISIEKFLVCFDKDALGLNKPSQKTIMSLEHSLLYQGEMHIAKWFIGKFEGVNLIPYNGETLYNVLMEKHDIIRVNNLKCETLSPCHPVAKFYTKQCKLSPENRDKIVKVLQDCLTRNNMESYNKILQRY